MSNLEDVFSHEHQDTSYKSNPPKVKRVINHARDIYPDCSISFACGVHTWINKGDRNKYLKNTLNYILVVCLIILLNIMLMKFF